MQDNTAPETPTPIPTPPEETTAAVTPPPTPEIITEPEPAATTTEPQAAVIAVEPEIQQFRTLLGAINRPDEDDQFLEIRVQYTVERDGWKGMDRRFFRTADEAIMFVTPVLTSRHVFFSVEPRFCKDGTKQGINKVTNIFVDIDPKGGVTQAEVVAKLQAMSHPPTAIVDSGNGIHAYWTLTEPLAISSPADIARIEGIMSALLTRLGGDPACKDISRVLRVAGSINVKDLENPKLVRILDIDDSRRYPLSLFEQPAEDGVGITIQQPKPTISQLITDMGDGDQHNRHPNLLSLAGKMIYRGMGYEDTMTAVQAIGRGVGTAPAEAARMVDYAASHRTDFTSVTSEDFSHFSKTVDTSVTSQPLKGADEVKSTPESRALLPCWDYLSRPVPPARWIIERVIPAEGVGVFAGYGRAGKSWIHMDMGLEVIRGGCWLGRFPCIERPVIYIDKENTLRLHKDRFGRLATDKGMDLSTVRNLFFDDAGRLALDKDAGQRWLLARLKDLGPSLVLIDSFSKIFSGDENSMKEVVQMTTPLVEIATRTGSFIMIIDHLGKAPSTGNAATIIKGSVEKFNFCDTVILGESTGHHCIDLEIPKQRCTGDEELKIPIEIKDVDENKVRLVVRDSGGECSFDPDAEGVDFVRGMVERELEVSRQTVLNEGKPRNISERKVDRAAASLANRGMIRLDTRPNAKTGRPNCFYIWLGGGSSMKPTAPEPSATPTDAEVADFIVGYVKEKGQASKSEIIEACGFGGIGKDRVEAVTGQVTPTRLKSECKRDAAGEWATFFMPLQDWEEPDYSWLDDTAKPTA